MQRSCIVCGKAYTNPGRRCNACRNKLWKKANREKDLAQRRAYNKRHYKPVEVTDKRCEFCDTLFKPNKHTPNQPYCSRLCRGRAWRKNNREHYRQRRKEERQRNAEWYKAYDKEYNNTIHFGGLRYRVLERDNDTCVDCLSKGKIVVHHIDFSKDNNVMNNLETLCRACHIRKHTHVLTKGVDRGEGQLAPPS